MREADHGAHDAARTKRGARLSAPVGFAISLGILCIALWFLHRELAEISFAAIASQVRSIAPVAVVASVLLAAGSYLSLTAYDALALRYIGQKLAYRKLALTSFMAYAVGHNVGLATLSGGSIRYRMYSLNGLGATDIAQIIVFVTVTFGLGASVLLGGALLAMPAAGTTVLGLRPAFEIGLGLALAAIPVGYVATSLLRRSPLTIRNWSLPLPRPPIAFTQIVVAVADLTFAAAALFVLLAPAIQIGFVPFLGLYLLAVGAGLISSVPGGVGVFEAVLVAVLPGVSAEVVLATVIVYRLIYYVIPLCLALVILVLNEAHHHRHFLERSSALVGDWLASIVPQATGVTVFLAGVVLLVSGASPAVEDRLRFIEQAMPLPLLELSHLVGSIVGVALLVLARGLFQRLRMAYLLTMLALATGIIVSLLKGLDYEEATILATIALVLRVCRAEFHRVGAVMRFSVAWVAAIAFALCCAAWVAFVSFRNVAYTNELWWQFAFDAQAPRALRASMAATVAVLIFALWRILRATPGPQIQVDPEAELAKVRRVLPRADDAAANVALLGDKRFLWSADETAFIMYQQSGASWVALGDPVGPVEAHESLIWSFRELVDRHNGRTVFYQVSDRFLPSYIDLGLSLAKLGEDAKVPLAGFNLEGKDRAPLRHAFNRARRDGASFEMIPRSAVPSITGELRRISDEWLEQKSTAEKGFSLGAFTESYVENFDCAVVRVDGAIVAFANLWAAGATAELSLDLMRYDERAPKGVMDYLITELMLWGAANGFRWFSLGMAPLSGMEQRSLAPLWHRLGHLIFTHGEGFYNFEGLRSYKEKFQPEWRPRYLACPGGWFDLPWALLDSSRLIAGGMTELLTK